MDSGAVLRGGCIAVRLKGATKPAVIEEMVDMMVAAGKLTDRQSAIDAIFERERKMSTGMQCGVAIPHAKLDTVDDLIAAFGLKPEGIDFDALDGQPSRIFVMTFSSVLRPGPHIQFLAAVSKQLSSAAVRDRLLQASSREEIVEIMTA